MSESRDNVDAFRANRGSTFCRVVESFWRECLLHLRSVKSVYDLSLIQEAIDFVCDTGGRNGAVLRNCEIETGKRSWQRERRSRRNEKERKKITDK